jgi:hypothetical protein
MQDTQAAPKDLRIWSLMIDNLDTHFDKVIYDVRRVMGGKLLDGKRDIDMQKFSSYYGLSECDARRVINYIEWNYYNEIQFLLINGSQEWKEDDAIRVAKIQKRQSG